MYMSRLRQIVLLALMVVVGAPLSVAPGQDRKPQPGDEQKPEQIIQRAMREAMAGKTVIAIAHRLSTVMDMDRLIVLDRGAIVADGSHQELLRRGGLYAELWARQSGGFLAKDAAE